MAASHVGDDYQIPLVRYAMKVLYFLWVSYSSSIVVLLWSFNDHLGPNPNIAMPTILEIPLLGE